jgi:hypothetical protein
VRARRTILTAYEHAHAAVTAALARGTLAPPVTCEACGGSPGPRQKLLRHGRLSRLTSQMVYHHHDYLLALDVIPLCRSCHRRVHLGLMVEPRTGRLYPQFISARKNHRAAGPALNADVVVWTARPLTLVCPAP